MSIATSVRVFTLLAISTGGACSEPEPTYLARYELDGLEVLSYDYDRICKGLLDGIDKENRRIRSTVGAPPILPVRLAYGYSAVENLCTPGLAGCAYTDRDTLLAVAVYDNVLHELTHAHRRQLSDWRNGRFLEEGLAEALQAGSMYSYLGYRSATTPLETSLEMTTAEVTGATAWQAGHFVSWMIDEFGLVPVMDMFSETRHDDDATVLEEHFGMSLDELELRWRTGTEPNLRVGAVCDNAPLYDLADGPLDLEFDLACGADGVLGPIRQDMIDWSRRAFCIDVPSTGARIEVTTDGGRAQLWMREGVSDCPLGGAETIDKYIDDGEPAEVRFSQCRWRGSIKAELDQVGSVRVVITPI